MSMQDRYETISFRQLVEQFLSAQIQGQGFYDSVRKLGWTMQIATNNSHINRCIALAYAIIEYKTYN